MKYLQFGCGPHKHLLLPAPWENYDKEVDITRPLPFAPECAKFILAEHVIEHVPFPSGLGFLKECYRILASNGVLRLSFPDITRIGPYEAKLYSDHLARYGKEAQSVGQVCLAIASEWEHVACWTAAMAVKLLDSIGFNATLSPYGMSCFPELNGVDRHHNDVGLKLAEAETTVIQARKL